jgi:hypothetical protein
MTQAAILAASGSPGTTTGFKNRIINGAMIIWQRGTSFSSTGYTADRWSFYAGTSPVVTQSTDVPSGFRYSAALSGTGSTGFTQKIESNNVSDLSGQSVTVSFWLKQSTGAGSNAISISLSYATAQDNFGSTTSIGSTNITTTASWAYYTATFNSLPSGVTNGLQCTIVTNSGSAVAFQLTGVQLEVGTTATNFDYRSIGTEFALCQRYYQVYSDAANSNYTFIWSGSISGATSSQYLSSILIPMRAAPTGTVINTNSSSMGTPGIATTTPSFARMTASGNSSDSRAYFQLNASFSAEL